MSTALDGGHIVGEGDYILTVAVVVLHRNLGYGAVLLPLHIYYVGVYGSASLLLVDKVNEGDDSAFVVEKLLTLPTLSLIRKNYLYSCVEEGLLPHTGKKYVKAEFGGFGKDGGVGLKSYEQTVSAVGVSLAPEFTGNRTLLKPLGIFLSVTAVLYLYPLGQGVNHGCSHTVQTACDLIALSSEFTSRVEDGIYYLQGRQT